MNEIVLSKGLRNWSAKHRNGDDLRIFETKFDNETDANTVIKAAQSFCPGAKIGVIATDIGPHTAMAVRAAGFGDTLWMK